MGLLAGHRAVSREGQGEKHKNKAKGTNRGLADPVSG